MPGARHVVVEVVEDKAQIRLACAVIDQHRRRLAPVHFVQQRLDELIEVVDLLELAPRVLIEPTLAREDVQLLEQLKRLAGAQLLNHLRRRRHSGSRRRLGHDRVSVRRAGRHVAGI